MDSFKNRMLALQQELKAPKDQFNSYGGYKYRSCEDIIESVKPLLAKYHLLMNISDDIKVIGDWVFVQAVVTIEDTESNEARVSTGYARIADNLKGQSPAQITGGSSSYARKYALNGLLLIDDTKDDDTNNVKPDYTAPDEEPKRSRKKEAETDTAPETKPETELNPFAEDPFAEIERVNKAEAEQAAAAIQPRKRTRKPRN